MRQFKCLLAWFKCRAGSPLFGFVFFREGENQREGGIDPDAGHLKNDFDVLKKVLKPALGDILETSLRAP